MLQLLFQGNAPNGHWRDELAPASKLREPGAVHEASCLWMGRDKATSVVDANYRPHGVENVYVTGGSLFPTSGGLTNSPMTGFWPRQSGISPALRSATS